MEHDRVLPPVGPPDNIPQPHGGAHKQQPSRTKVDHDSRRSADMLAICHLPASAEDPRDAKLAETIEMVTGRRKATFDLAKATLRASLRNWFSLSRAANARKRTQRTTVTGPTR